MKGRRILSLMAAFVLAIATFMAVSGSAVTARADDMGYDILEGNHSEWTKDAGDLYFRIDTRDAVDAIKVDGRTLTPERDYTDYTEDGKRVVRLSVDYLLPSLKNGRHSIFIWFVQGETVEADFNVSGQGEVSPVGVYFVTLFSNTESGGEIKYRSDDGTIKPSYDTAENCQFYYDGNDVCFKLSNDYLPESFEPPTDDLIFAGWEKYGGIKLENTDTTITALWYALSNWDYPVLRTLSFSEGTLKPAFSPDITTYYLDVNYTGSPISVTAEAIPLKDTPAVSVLYNNQDTCPNLTAGDVLKISLADRTNIPIYNDYSIEIRAVYSITPVIEGNGTVFINAFNAPDVESQTGFAEHLMELSAKPADGWKFKEWQLISGNGSFRTWGPLGARYKIGSDNAVIKAVFEPAVDSISTALYNVIEGANGKAVKGSGEGLAFKTDGEYTKFTGIKIDSKEVVSSMYDSGSGSTVVSLKPSLIDKLDVGRHTIEFLYTDGSCGTEFEVQAAAAPTKAPTPVPTKTPTQTPTKGSGGITAANTGDNTPAGLCMLLLTGSLGSLILVFALRRRTIK